MRPGRAACRDTRTPLPTSPQRKLGDSGRHTFPAAVQYGFEPEPCLASCGIDGGLVFVPGVPGFPPGAFCQRVARGPAGPRATDESHVAGGHRVTPATGLRLWIARDDGVVEVTRLAALARRG